MTLRLGSFFGLDVELIVLESFLLGVTFPEFGVPASFLEFGVELVELGAVPAGVPFDILGVEGVLLMVA